MQVIRIKLRNCGLLPCSRRASLLSAFGSLSLPCWSDVVWMTRGLLEISVFWHMHAMMAG